MFEFRRQPFKTLYFLYAFLSILLVRLPYWVVVSAIPSARPRKSWPMSRSLIVHVLNAVLGIMYATSVTERVSPDKDAAAPEKTGFVWVELLPDSLVQGDVAIMARVNNVKAVKRYGYWLGQRAVDGSHGQKAEPGERVLYYLHGKYLRGGYTRGSGSPNSPTAGIPKAILGQCGGLVGRSFCIDYRLSSAPPFTPANPFPAALIDAMSGYRYLIEVVEFQPENIILSGDSAGGHLAVALIRYLIQLNNPSVPPPAAVILLSPTVDWACTHDDAESSSMHTNAKSDFVSIILKSGYSARGLLGNLPWEDLATNVYLSPASLQIQNPAGLFSQLPPTCLVVGGAEQTRDPMRTLRERIIADNDSSNLRYLEYEDAFHDFIGLEMHEPERSMALREIQAWLEQVMPQT
ncbi:AB hydrolase superfamily protein C4A8.06c [Leucoagaricus sp. SymC.cos]|nr:AB hydrolase superfamily protein C4A8.06c [Leucoagaricus sp. SymC.cos]